MTFTCRGPNAVVSLSGDHSVRLTGAERLNAAFGSNDDSAWKMTMFGRRLRDESTGMLTNLRATAVVSSVGTPGPSAAKIGVVDSLAAKTENAMYSATPSRRDKLT